MKFISTLMLLSACGYAASAQNFTISGTVQNDKETPVPYANVSLLNGADSSWLQTAVANESGIYQLSNVAKGVYLLNAQTIGYEPKQIKLIVTSDRSNVSISLTPDNAQMEEVVVKGKRNKIETALGKTIVNVSKEMKAGKNLLDLLRDVPGVRVSATGEVSIEGKAGITILIDDKQVHFTGKSLTEYLRSVDAGKVDKIELMTNPSARYDAAGNSGMLSIEMKEPEDNGLYGGLNGNFIQSQYPFGSAGGNINYRNEKLGLHLTPGYYEGQGTLSTDRVTTSRDVVTDEIRTVVNEYGFLLERFADYSLDVTTDYDFSKATTASLSIKGVYHPNDETDKYKTEIVDAGTGIARINTATRERGFIRKNIQANMFLKHDIDSNNNIVVNGDYFRESRKAYQRIRSIDHDINGVPVPEPFLLNNNIPIQSSVSSIKADYESQLTEHAKIEAGLKTSYVTIEDPNDFEIYRDGEWVNDTGRTNHFLYDESISAAYVSGNAASGKWQAQAGVRVEHTYAKGREEITGQEFERNYTSVFPTAYVNYKANDKHSFEVNYGKRIQRPFYRELNPFTLVTSLYNYSTGNPYLLPMFTHNMELKHNYRNRLIATVSYSVTNGVFTETLRFEPATNVSHYSTTNNGRKHRGALSAYFNKQINDWWGVTVNARGFYIQSDGVVNGSNVRSEGYGCFMRVDTQLTIKKDWHLQAGAWYSSPFVTSAVSSSAASLYTSAQVSKSILHDSGSIRLSVTDPFNIFQSVATTEAYGVTTVNDNKVNVRNISIGFNYNFGNTQRTQRRRERAEEVDRI